MQLRTILRKGKPCNWFLAVASVNEVVFYLTLAHDGEILRDRYNIDFPSTLRILKDQSQFAVFGRNMPADLSLSLTSLESLDLVLSHDLASGETLRKVENFD